MSYIRLILIVTGFAYHNFRLHTIGVSPSAFLFVPCSNCFHGGPIKHAGIVMINPIFDGVILSVTIRVLFLTFCMELHMTTTNTTTARTMAQVKALFPECFTLSIVDAVAAATDKGAAVDLIARAIVGAALEYGHSGSDSRLKSARDSLMGKGKGAQVRARAVLAIDAIKGDIKPRALVALDDGAIVDWVIQAMAQAVDALTPAPVVRKAPTAKPAPEAGVTAPEAGVTAPEAGVTAPEAGVTAPEVADIVAAILAGAYDVDAMLAISAALGKAPTKAPAKAPAKV